MSDNRAQSGGIGFAGMLAILFIGLKLTHHIEWSWVWVLSPLWIPLGVAIAVATVWLIIVGVFGLAGVIMTRGRR